ncbi:MAG: outer membrane protein assembly factor BamD [Geminicoccaceae bacterium]
MRSFLNFRLRLPARLLALAAGGVMLAGCATSDSEPEYVERPAEELYAEAQALLDEKDYKAAARAFEEVERQHPYSSWAVRGQIMAAYAYYEGLFYLDAVSTLESFIELHPGNKDVPYAHYLIGRSYYDQITDVGRDQEMTEKALEAFRVLTQRYPDSDYARDAALKMDLARDHLAGKEMEVGRYYQRQQQYVAAINRFREVVERYQTTTHVPEALHRLTECYLALGVTNEAQATAAVLGYNYPESSWYAKSYALLQEESLEPGVSEGSWLSNLF